MKLRSLSLTMATLIGGTAIGATTQHLASANVSSGERPVLISITPCRLADTRPGDDTVGPRSSELGAGESLTVDAQEVDTPCSGSIPTDASALSLNITALGATELSYLTVWPDGERPLAASLNPAPGQPPVPNAVTTELSPAQTFEVYNASGRVHIVVDVNGYYVDHDHDDRYPLATDVAAADSAHDAALTALEAAATAQQGRIADLETSAGQQKFMNLNLMVDVEGADAQPPFGRSVAQNFDHTVVLPPDYTPGGELRLELTVTGGGNAVACSLELRNDYLRVSRPDFVIPSQNSSVGSNVTLTFGADQNRTRRAEFVFVPAPGVSFQAGDALQLGVFSTNDTCPGAGAGTPFFRGAALYYD